MATPNVATAATANRDLTNKRFIRVSTSYKKPTQHAYIQT
jgi:hypothetical protein